MTVRATSVESFHKEKRERMTQERRLYEALARIKPGGLTDARIAEILGIPNALAAARRAGLTKTVAVGGKERLQSIGTQRSHRTAKTVHVWGLVDVNPKAAQGSLF